MSVRMVARPVGEDGFEVSISGANFGKGSYRATDYLTRDRLDPPEYPAEAQRMGGKGTVYLVLRIGRDGRVRSEEHTSELQSIKRKSYAVLCLTKTKNND